jgi:hypothetical protein
MGQKTDNGEADMQKNYSSANSIAIIIWKDHLVLVKIN